MKVKALAEVRELVASADFQGWWEELSRTRVAEVVAADRFDELLTQSTLLDFRAELAQKNAIDTLYRAGSCEDAAAKLVAEATDVENRSFEVVAGYEEQRFHVSEIWYRLGAAEKALEELRERVAVDRGALEQAGADRAKLREAESILAEAEVDLRKAEKEHRQIHDDYERETQRKLRLWDEVERLWASSAEMNLLVSEKRAEGRKIRKRAERLFKEAEERKTRSKALRADADQQSAERARHSERLAQLLQQARERFGCAVGEEFLYWRQREDQSGAYCVSLIDDSEDYNIELKALGIYRAEKQRGVEFLEPSQEKRRADEGDQRFEDFFLRGRKGTIRQPPTEASGS
ncbi:MAG TPA: hypothetical protein VMB50_19680 [Myxococcales bacterium]|nr:hypothetical protein [Myxococcales bacterium]